MEQEQIIITKISDEEFTAKFNDESIPEIGDGVDGKSAVKDLFYKIESNQLKTEKENQELFIKTNMEDAKQMAIEMFNIMGPDFFSIDSFQNKTGFERQDGELRLNYLISFGIVQKDRDTGAGKRYKIVIDSDSLQQHYFNEAEKWESTSKYYRALAEELTNVDANIRAELQKRAEEQDEDKSEDSTYITPAGEVTE